MHNLTRCCKHKARQCVGQRHPPTFFTIERVGQNNIGTRATHPCTWCAWPHGNMATETLPRRNPRLALWARKKLEHKHVSWFLGFWFLGFWFLGLFLVSRILGFLVSGILGFLVAKSPFMFGARLFQNCQSFEIQDSDIYKHNIFENDLGIS